MWPFRKADNEAFQTTPKSIYDELSDGLTPASFDGELAKYEELRLKKGVMQSVMPASCYGGLIGVLTAIPGSKLEGRYTGRMRLILKNGGAGMVLGTTTAAIHHLLLIQNSYLDNPYLQSFSGVAGSAVTAGVGNSFNFSTNTLGVLFGVAYVVGCQVTAYWHKRKMQTFFKSQQQMQTPVNKVSPDLQMLYRSYLFDYRPVEEHSKIARQAALVSRAEEDDVRLDANTLLAAMCPDFYYWISFPDWWPLKTFQDEEEMIISSRLSDERVARRKEEMLADPSRQALRHYSRSPQHRGE